jgi:hypothetical protein
VWLSNEAIKSTIITGISKWIVKDAQWTMNETGTTTNSLAYTEGTLYTFTLNKIQPDSKLIFQSTIAGKLYLSTFAACKKAK